MESSHLILQGVLETVYGLVFCNGKAFTVELEAIFREAVGK